MGTEAPNAPGGNGKHPITLVVISAGNLAASVGFYRELFGWAFQPISAELAGAVPPAGPTAALRAGPQGGSPAVVPYIGVPDVDGALARLVDAGGTLERAPWEIPGVGRLARFKDPSGTIYGLSKWTAEMPRIPAPFGSNPKPPAGTICSLEMYAAEGSASATFFASLFGWGMQATMPHYITFEPGSGIGGVFQSHTPTLPAVAYIHVEDVGEKLAAIEAAGGKRMGDPMRMEGLACFGYFTDPSGTTMGLMGA